MSYDTGNEELQKQVLEVVRGKAQQIWTAVHMAHAAMDPQSPKPDMHLYSDDFIMGKDDIAVTPKQMKDEKEAAENADKSG